MAVVEIDGGDAKTFQRLVACGMDVLWLVTDSAPASLWVDVVGEFGGEEDVVAFAGSLEPSVLRIASPSMVEQFRGK